MNKPLAIFAPHIGLHSETFIRRHMQDLLPGGTVVVTGNVDGPYAGHWSVDCPVLALNQIQRGGLKQQVLQAIAYKVGLRPTENLVVVKRFLQKYKVQVILGEYLDVSLPLLSLAQELGIRFFAHAHGYDVSMQLRNPKWQTEYLCYNQADGVITMSQVSRARLLGLGLEPAKVHVIPYGTDLPAEPLIRAERETVHCLAVGRMVTKKAPILLLDAFRRALKVFPNLRLDYIGTGNLLPAVQQFIRAFSLSDKVRLYGGQPSEVVYQLMKDADIFLQHSMTDPDTGDEEGLPVSILEAMAHALPVVSTRHAGIPESVLDGSTGYLVEEGDSVGMAEGIGTLAREPDLRRRMGKAGWSWAKEHFSWEKECLELQQILEIT